MSRKKTKFIIPRFSHDGLIKNRPQPTCQAPYSQGFILHGSQPVSTMETRLMNNPSLGALLQAKIYRSLDHPGHKSYLGNATLVREDGPDDEGKSV